MLATLMAQAAPVVPTDPASITTIVSILTGAGPFALAAVLIWMRAQDRKDAQAREADLLRRLDERAARSDAQAAEFLAAVREQSRIAAESSETIRAVRDGLQRVEDRVDACPRRLAGDMDK